MHIAQIEITNLRSFNGTQSISLAREDGSFPGWIVFAGRNGSGKSTLLKALAASIVGPLAARALAGAFPAWVRQGARVARVATQLTVDNSRDGYVEKGGTTKEPFW